MENMVFTLKQRWCMAWVLCALASAAPAVEAAPETAAAAAPAPETVRKELGPALLAAQAATKEQRWTDVLTALAPTDAVTDKTDFEVRVIERMRGVAALSLNDVPAADAAMGKVVASAGTSDADAQRISVAVLAAAFNAKQYALSLKWLDLYRQRGGADAAVLANRADMLYQLDRPAQAAAALEEELKGRQDAAAKPRLELLASSYLKVRDNNAYRRTLERLVAVAPSPAYWGDLIQRTEAQDHFAMRLQADACRLRRHVAALQDADDYQYCAQVLHDGASFNEAQAVLAAGPTTGSKAEQTLRSRLAPLVREEADQVKRGSLKPETANARVNVGWLYVVNGQVDKGLALIKQGVEGSGLKNPATAQLRYGEALVLARRQDEARKVFEAINGNEGERDLARLWLIALATQS